MTEDTTQRALGRLEGQVTQVLKMLTDSTESRARLHERVDDVADRLGKIEGDINIAGQIDAQVRSELDSLKVVIEANRVAAEPAMEAWQDVLKTGRRAAWVFSIAGIGTIGGLIGLLVGFWDWIARVIWRL